jgi:hypothetical protein
MIEITKNLFIGNQIDYDSNPGAFSGWQVIHACKEPYHRQALGYTGRGAPKEHPEYLIAERGNRLILNLVDAADYQYIPKEIIDKAVEYIGKALKENTKVLVHCNQGESRSPTIGLLYLANTGLVPIDSYESALPIFMGIYPQYNPAKGITDFARIHWIEYVERNKQ